MFIQSLHEILVQLNLTSKLPGMSKHCKWIRLKSLPYGFTRSPQLIQMNDNQYIIISSVVNDAAFIKYDTLKDKFSDPIEIDNEQHLQQKDYINCTYNSLHRMLFIYNKIKRKLGVIGGSTNKFREILDQMQFTHPNYVMVSSEDTIHILRQASPDHYIFNIKSAEVTHHTPQQTQIDYIDQAIVLKSEKRILTFDYDKVYEYSVKDQIWTKLYTVSGLGRYSFSASVVTNDARYIIFLGENSGTSNDIMILNRDEQNLIKSKIKCPLIASFNATLVYDDKRDELLTFGFINACFRSLEFENMIKLPHYLIKHIKKWISIEYVHLIFHEYSNSKAISLINHWKINVDDILKSIV